MVVGACLARTLAALAIPAQGPRKAGPYDDDGGWMQNIDGYPQTTFEL